MIAKITKGNSPAGVLKYCAKEDSELLETNCASSSWDGIAYEMDEMSKGNKRCDKHCIHITLSAPRGERLTNEQWKQAAAVTRRELGLQDNQFALSRHSDTDHDHAHLVVERVDSNGKAWSDKFERTRTHSAMRVVEHEVGLQKFSEHTSSKDGRFESVKKDLNDSIKSAGGKGLDGFKSEMNSRGYDVIENRQSTGRLAGLSVKARSDGKTWKASELRKGGAWSIETQLDRQAKSEQKSQESQQAKSAATASKEAVKSGGKAMSDVLGKDTLSLKNAIGNSPLSGITGSNPLGNITGSSPISGVVSTLLKASKSRGR